MKNIKYSFIFTLLFGIIFSQPPTPEKSVVTISGGGPGTAATSAHITIGTNATKCPDEYVIDYGASLTIWGSSAICGAEVSSRVISGYVNDENINPVQGVSIAFSNGGPTVLTNSSGFYTADVPYGWSGTSTPSKSSWRFIPENYSYSNVTDDFENQNFIAGYLFRSISGNVLYSDGTGVEGVKMEYSNGGIPTTTDADGYYRRSVPKGWSGTVTPSKNSFVFTPTNRSYSNLADNQYHQDYTTPLPPNLVRIYGTVLDENGLGMGGVQIDFTNGGVTVYTEVDGTYWRAVPLGYSGIATPTMTNYNFKPNSYSYTSLSADIYEQDYTGSDGTLEVEDITALPTDFTVLPAYPNPFNPSTTLRYGLDSDSYVTITIYDISGQLITTLQNTKQLQGWHSVVWNGTNKYGEQVPAGLYLSRITSDKKFRTIKLMLLK